MSAFETVPPHHDRPALVEMRHDCVFHLASWPTVLVRAGHRQHNNGADEAVRSNKPDAASEILADSK